MRKYSLSHGMSGVHSSCCPGPAAGQAVCRTHESLGILRACGQCHRRRALGLFLKFPAVDFWHNYKKEYPGIYFEIDAQQTCSSLDNDISASSSEGIQILGMRCQPLIASKGSSDDLR